MSGAIIDVGGQLFFIPVAAVHCWRSSRLAVAVLPSGNPPRHDGLLPAAEVLGQSVLGLTGSGPRVTDVALRRTSGGWTIEASTAGTVRSISGRDSEKPA